MSQEGLFAGLRVFVDSAASNHAEISGTISKNGGTVVHQLDGTVRIKRTIFKLVFTVFITFRVHTLLNTYNTTIYSLFWCRLPI
jgi:hypothetical protein